jgi:glutamyl endopeptidase
VVPQQAEASSFPFVAYLKVVFPFQAKTGKFTVGTGTLIAPRLILTAGHVVYEQAAFAQSIIVTLGGTSGRTIRAEEVETTQQWIQTDSSLQSPTSAFDYGVVVLPAPVDSLIAPLQVETASDHDLLGMTLNVAGYPDSAKPLGTLFGGRAAVSDLSGHRLFYPINTYPGMSGGPAYSFDQTTGQRAVRGVHTALLNGLGTAVRINENVHSLIAEWKQRFRP